MRKLATVQKIIDIQPIAGKDRIVLATVLGWHVIVPSTMKIGDLCIYVEIDSVLPERPEFEFLRPRCFSEKKGGFSIKTMKMGGVISQGIVFPLDILPAGTYSSSGLSEGSDVTDLLGVRKWDPEINDPAERKITSKNPIINYMLRFKWFRDRMFPPPVAWPSWAPHSDETRVQALGEQWLHDNFDAEKFGPCYASIKKDGQSALYGFVDGEFWACSRNKVLFKGRNTKKMKIDSTWARVCAQEDMGDLLRRYAKQFRMTGKGEGFFIQGEICGPSIQGNKYHYEHLNFFVFNFGIVENGRLKSFADFTTLKLHCAALGLKTVPIFDETLLIGQDTTIDSLVELSKQTDPDYDTPIEGLVIRPWYSRLGDGNSGPALGFKVINPDFLLKHDL